MSGKKMRDRTSILLLRLGNLLNHVAKKLPFGCCAWISDWVILPWRREGIRVGLENQILGGFVKVRNEFNLGKKRLANVFIIRAGVSSPGLSIRPEMSCQLARGVILNRMYMCLVWHTMSGLKRFYWSSIDFPPPTLSTEWWRNAQAIKRTGANFRLCN